MRALPFATGSPSARAVRILLDEPGRDHERREEITAPSLAGRAAAIFAHGLRGPAALDLRRCVVQVLNPDGPFGRNLAGNP